MGINVLSKTLISRKEISIFVIIFFCVFYQVAAQAFTTTEGIRIYPHAAKLSTLHKKKLAADISHYRNADNLWDMLRESFTLSHYEAQPAVQERIDWFMNNPVFLLQAASRAAPYLYYISEQVKARHLPTELVLLPIIESGYNPFAISNMGASGIWQMMPDTATGLGIRQDAWYDGRRDIIASTRAALNYLAYLQNFFDGNWLLAIAAYNTGEGNVLSAIKKNIREGKRTNFWSLPVSQQTKDYVPSLLALAIIISHPEDYPVYLPPVRNAPYLAQVEVNKHINLKSAAQYAGLSFKRLILLNAGFNRTAVKGPYKLVIPIENVEQFTENLLRHRFGKNPKWTNYYTKPGDSLKSLAKKFNTDVGTLQRINHLNGMKLHAKQKILIPNRFPTTNSVEFANIETPKAFNSVSAVKVNDLSTQLALKKVFNAFNYKYKLQPGDTIYMTRDHDTLAAVSKRFRIGEQNIIIANNLESRNLQPGKQLIIPTHLNNLATRSEEPDDRIYEVRKGDTIDTIAHRFNISPAELRLANLMNKDYLTVGEKLVVPTHLGS